MVSKTMASWSSCRERGRWLAQGQSVIGGGLAGTGIQVCGLLNQSFLYRPPQGRSDAHLPGMAPMSTPFAAPDHI